MANGAGCRMFRMLHAKRWALLPLCAAALFPLRAQVSTGEIAGTIADASGAAVPNAKVTATNTETNSVARETITSTDGAYTMTLLPPGVYTIAAEASGFRRTVQTAVELQTNQRIKVDLQLQVGQVTETVEV